MTVSTFACLEKAVECSLFSTLFDFLSNLSLPILQSDNLPIWQSDNLTISQSDNLAIWQSCNLTALSPLTDCNHLINNSPFAAHNCNRSNSFGKFWSKSAQSKSLRKSVSGNKKHSTSRFFPNNCPRKGNWGTISKPHLCRCRTFDNHQRWQTHNVEKSLSKIEKPSWANKRQFWKHLNDDCSQGIIVVCKSCPYHGVEIVRTLHPVSAAPVSIKFQPSSAPSYRAYTSYDYLPITQLILSRQVIPVIPVQHLLIMRTPPLPLTIMELVLGLCRDKWYQWYLSYIKVIINSNQ